MRPYRIDVAPQTLSDLHDRLARTRWPEPTYGEGWTRGMDQAWLRELCGYWREHYDWRAQEAAWNVLPQFVTAIDGIDIHFIRIRAGGPRAGVPLLMLHGWPGSIAEFDHVIGPLTEPAAHGMPGPAFDLVLPSLPGFGFSGKPREAGWHADRIAAAFHVLMTHTLGYPRYGLQGGDWGSIIGRRLAVQFPEDLIGLHLNMPYGPPPSPEDPFAPQFQKLLQSETGYLSVQNTRPDALTIAQTDSPAGLAAWVLEKFHAWSGRPADLDARFGRDRLITNLMFYWVTDSAHSAARQYYENAQRPPWFLHPRIDVPTAFAVFPDELYRVPRAWLEPQFDIRRWTQMPRGGHFAAMDEPQLLVEDVRAFFGALT
jgi:epoxide hydrolase